MRIQASFQPNSAERSHNGECLQSTPEINEFNSTLVFAARPSFNSRAFAFIMRKVSNFFRSILSCILPIKPRAAVNVDEIAYLKSGNDPQEMKYQILLNGFSTNNEIKFKKIGETLYLQEITFPDQEMREHIHAILDHMMKKEEVDALITDYLDKAKILWECGFSTDDSISFDPEKSDYSNLTIKNIIEAAQKKKGSLNAHYLPILQRIEKIMTAEEGGVQRLMDSFVDLGASLKIIAPRSPGVVIRLTDLLCLLEIVDVGSVRGVRFANYRQGKSPIFKNLQG